MLINRDGGSATVIGLITGVLGFLGSVIGVATGCYNFRKIHANSWKMLRWRKAHLEDLIRQLDQPMEGSINPATSAWINEAREYARDELNIEELQKTTSKMCCLGNMDAGLDIDRKLGELDILIERGQRISKESTTRGYIRQETNFFGSTVVGIRGEIWQEVSNGVFGTICIHGIAGVGKTAIAVAINNQALRAPDELFDFVIWVDVSNGADLWRVQEDVASVISEKLPADPNTDNRAGKLCTALTGKRKFLLILDSMWQGYSPSDIGIPELTGGRKLIVTSRLRSVFNSFRGRKCYEIKPLVGADTWNLFACEAGSDVVLNLPNDILSRTKTAIQDLQGVPLAIKKLAETLRNICEAHFLEDTLRNKNEAPWEWARIVEEWEEVLEWLRRSATFLENRNHELFSHLQKGYQNLRAETQRCFLFCALYPKAHHIETKELIDYWMWEGLLGSGTLREMRCNGRQRLNELLDARLLETASEVGKEEKVQMLNLIQDMALAIVGEKFLVKAGNRHTQFPLAGASPKGVVRMSFMRNQLGVLVLPSTYNFNMLSTLLLQDNPFNQSHHNSLFFDCMGNLEILDLSHTTLSFLPDSLSNLTNLRALLLRNCRHLSYLPALSNLNRLHVLDLSGTRLQQWPEGMDMLTNLRSLDLTQAKLDTFPADCISSYKRLEELLMMWDINNTGCVWASHEVRDWNGACVEWLPALGHLADLQLVFLNAMVFNKYMNACHKTADGYAITTTCFNFLVGGFHSAGVECNSHENSITMIGNNHIMLPEGTSVLNLMNCPDDVRSLNMTGCFRDLTVLDVFALTGLKYLLTLDMWHSLGNLRKICVRRCRNMVGITQPAEVANPRIISHSSLVELVLFDLQSLQSVDDGQALHFKNLIRIKVWMCGLLRLPDLHGVRGDNVIEIEGEREWWDAFQQHNPGIFDGCPVRFKEVPAPPNMSSSPRFTEVSDTFLSSPSNDAEQEIDLDKKTPEHHIVSSNHPLVLHPSAGIGSGDTESDLLQNVQKAGNISFQLHM
ncbi:hypothetical protein Ancab_004744 [Ancistrocladus abbreviatus]